MQTLSFRLGHMPSNGAKKSSAGIEPLFSAAYESLLLKAQSTTCAADVPTGATSAVDVDCRVRIDTLIQIKELDQCSCSRPPRLTSNGQANANPQQSRGFDSSMEVRGQGYSRGASEGLCSIPRATGGIARLACARLREVGKDVAAVLAEVGAKPEQVNDDAVQLEVPKQIRILELAAEELRDGILGFHLARNFDLREIGLVYYVIASSERLADALLNGRRYCSIMNEGIRLDVRLDDRTVTIALDYVDVDRHSDRHQIEFWLVTVMRICRQVTDTRLAPRHVRIRHRNDKMPAEFRSFFGCDVEFGASSDEIIFPASVAALSIVGRDNYLNDLLQRYAEAALPPPSTGARLAPT